MFKSPRSLLKTYRLGFEGALCDPVDVDRLLGDLPHPLFGAAAWSLEESGAGKLSLPFKSLVKSSWYECSSILVIFFIRLIPI